MHVDMDAFFASVEQRDHPEWQGKPVIVGGLSVRGVVATASYEARKFGIHSAMPIARAKMLCPDGIFARPRFEVYRAVSDEIHRIMMNYADDIEPLSLDEAFLDITGLGRQYATVGAVGRSIKADILKATALTASAGIAPNKFLAKMASDMNKPDGLCIIPYGKEAAVLAPLPVRRLWGVGPRTEEKLMAAGYHLIGDIQRTPLSRLEEAVGTQAAHLQALSRGEDDRPVVAERQVKSIGDEETYEEDLTDRKEIERQLAIHADVVARRLRKKGLAARTVSVKIRFASFRTVSRAASFGEATCLEEDLYERALSLLEKIPLHEGVRLIGVTASSLAEPVEEESLFPGRREALMKAARAMDAIQEKYGEKALRKGFWMAHKKKEEEPSSQGKNRGGGRTESDRHSRELL